VEDISVSVSDTVNVPTLITATVENRGNSAAGDFWLNYYVDNSYIGNDWIGLLGSGSSNDESIWYTASTPGPHDVRVYVDSHYEVSESNESNNALTESFTWRGPDLIVKDIRVVDILTLSSSKVDQPAYITAEIENQGNSAAGSFKLNYYVDGSYIGNKTILLLDDGSSNNETISYTASTPGPHSVRVYVDSHYEVSELNETNNERTEWYPWLGADLKAYGVSVSDTTVDRGDWVNVSWTAENQGLGNAVLTKQGVMWSTDSTIDRNDYLLSREPVGVPGFGFRAGDTSYEVNTIAIPDDPAIAVYGQTYYIGIYADYDEESGETDESNNASGAIPVTISRPDLVALNVRVSDTMVSPGKTIKVSWDAENHGGGVSGITQQGIIWSADNTITTSYPDRLLDTEGVGPLPRWYSSPEEKYITIPNDAI
jgi:subtilase family serine protease